ncbi:hypothetical protein [Nocardia transvalensis]|uniref:hypothetical protein n=1 Tax=Nocardia transvalensis TaxID=37333 RepID=UPI001894B524|nr:hypothetical protein [Nocardia transvalensis]MBF6328531.1 hypothetical protein [Nocardia transvalensis]
METGTLPTHPTAPGKAERISVDDVAAVILRKHAPMMQLLWWVDNPVDVSRLNDLRHSLINGPLSRSLVPARIPLARPYWTRSTYSYPVTIDPDPVPATEAMRWADHQVAAASLDVRAGRGWALSAANLDDGGSIVSAVVSHAITDGQGGLAALDLAARADLSQALPDHQRPTLRDDLVDAFTVGARAYLRAALPTALVRAQATKNSLILSKLVSGTGRGAGDAGPLPVVVGISTDQLRDVAAAHGGTMTGLITAIAVNVAHSVNDYRVRTLRIMVPVSLREAGDTSADNQAARADYELDLPAGTRYTDLAEIRRRSKAAYAAAEIPSGTAGQRFDVLISNVGLVSPEVIDAVGSARAFAARAVIPPPFLGIVGAEDEAILVYAVHSPETTYLTFQLTPRWKTPLGPHLDRELQHWEVTPQHTTW